MRLLPLGDTALLVEVAGLPDVIKLHAVLTAARRDGQLPGVADLVPAERTVLIRFDPGSVTLETVTAWVRRAALSGPPPVADADAGTQVCLAVRYDGEDLDEVGRLTGLGAAGVIAAHTASLWTVAFTGFAPGFGYLVGGDPRLRVPRLPTPRVRVPAGAVAVAGDYCGVYPRATPGGWRLIGRTDAAVWDLRRQPPALLRPGVKVRFADIAATS